MLKQILQNRRLQQDDVFMRSENVLCVQITREGL
jgi:hypothetical protein